MDQATLRSFAHDSAATLAGDCARCYNDALPIVTRSWEDDKPRTAQLLAILRTHDAGGHAVLGSDLVPLPWSV